MCVCVCKLKKLILTPLLQGSHLRALMSLPHLMILHWTTPHHCQPSSKTVVCV